MDKDELKTLAQVIDLLGGLIDSIDSRETAISFGSIHMRLYREYEYWQLNTYESPRSLKIKRATHDD